MSFDRPLFLLLGLLAPLELLLGLLRLGPFSRSVSVLAGPRRREAVVAGFRAASIGGSAASALCLLCLAAALAGPSWGSRARTAERSGLELAIVIDVSRSMLAADGAPTRLAAARTAARAALDAAPSASFSLVAAKGAPVLLVPMTEDREALETGIEYADPETLSAAGTDLGAGIRGALDSFPAQAGSSRAILLLSDGGDLAGGALTAAAEARRRGCRLVVIGVGGNAPAPVPGPGGTWLLDEGGARVTSALDARLLESIARTGGGRYLDAADSGGAAALARELATLAKGGTRVEFERRDRTGGFALAAFILLGLRLLAESLALSGGGRRP